MLHFLCIFVKTGLNMELDKILPVARRGLLLAKGNH